MDETAASVTVQIEGRELIVRLVHRGYYGHSGPSRCYDVFEVTATGEQRLTRADPFGELPTFGQLVSFLSDRKQALVALMAEYDITANDDYQYQEIYESIESQEPIPRWASVHGDGTYHDLHLAATLAEALDALSGIVGAEYLGLPIGVYDLDQKRMLAIETTVTLAEALPDPGT